MDTNDYNRIMAETIGFKVKEFLAEEFSHNNSVSVCLKEAKELYRSGEYQIKMFAVFVFGNISDKSPAALDFLQNIVSKDANWRIQEVLAMSFALYYQKKGYAHALPVLQNWLQSENPNLRRAVTEGLRPWTKFDHFKENPREAITLLSKYKEDESEYVRKSVGNALKDIGKKYKELLLDEVGQWDLANKKIMQTHKHAMRLINKQEIK
jgi:3-methyladenine DNA glycosylase AlkC